MARMTFSDFRSFMVRHNERVNAKVISGIIVFTEDSFGEPYTLESRSYVVNSDNKMFRPKCCGNSLFGSALDGSDCGVKLSEYMRGADGWKVDYCYLLNGCFTTEEHCNKETIKAAILKVFNERFEHRKNTRSACESDMDFGGMNAIISLAHALGMSDLGVYLDCALSDALEIGSLCSED